MQIALVVYDGVLADECASFRSVLERLPDATLVTVGPQHGAVSGPGGVQVVDAAFHEITRPDIVVVPGGLGCERRAADPSLRGWLHDVAPTARWIVASSTGSVVLAAAGLLGSGSAATHWLAVGLLERYGVEHSEQRLLVSGNVVTCEGRVTALEAAFTVAEQCAGSEVVARIRHQLLEHDVPDVCPRRWYHRFRVDRAPRQMHRAEHSGEPIRFNIELAPEPRDERRPHRRQRRSG